MFPFPISTCQISSHLQYLSLPHNSKCSSGSLAPKPINHLKRPAELEDDLAKSQRIQGSKRKYETTRKWVYKYSWEKGRPWLCYSVSKMWCAACSAAGLSNVFTSGVSTMKLDSIQSHELSKAHPRSLTAFNARYKGVPEETPASQALILLKHKEAPQVGITFRSAHAVAKHQGAVSIRKTVLPGMAIPMLKIRRPNGRLIFNMEITIRR